MFVATPADAQSTRFVRTTADGRRVWRSEYFGPPPSPRGAILAEDGPQYVAPAPGESRPPQAFLVEQESGAVVAPHFHYVDQFQVIAAGQGHLGRHEVAPLTVHFAGASTGYGPIVPGGQGLAYFTFRASADETGAQYLPGKRARMGPGPRRNVVVERILQSNPAALARTASRIEYAASEPDGLAVCMLRIAPGDVLAAPDAAAGDGASMLVATGALDVQGKPHPAWSCLYVPAEEGAVALRAGPQGAEVLYLRYPRRRSSTSD